MINKHEKIDVIIGLLNQEINSIKSKTPYLGGEIDLILDHYILNEIVFEQIKSLRFENFVKSEDSKFLFKHYDCIKLIKFGWNYQLIPEIFFHGLDDYRLNINCLNNQFKVKFTYDLANSPHLIKTEIFHSLQEVKGLDFFSKYDEIINPTKRKIDEIEKQIYIFNNNVRSIIKDSSKP